MPIAESCPRLPQGVDFCSAEGGAALSRPLFSNKTVVFILQTGAKQQNGSLEGGCLPP
jgi:hypothetical protein